MERPRLLMDLTLAWAALQGIYWAAAVPLRGFLTLHDGRLMWTSGGPGSFLPFPHPPGVFTVLTEIATPWDAVIGYLVYTGLWSVLFAGTTVPVYFAVRRIMRRWHTA